MIVRYVDEFLDLRSDEERKADEAALLELEKKSEGKNEHVPDRDGKSVMRDISSDIAVSFLMSADNSGGNINSGYGDNCFWR